MKNAWYKLPSKIRRGIAYTLMILGLGLLLGGILSMFVKSLDVMSASAAGQVDDYAKYAVEKSFGVGSYESAYEMD